MLTMHVCVVAASNIYLHIPSLHRNQASLGGVDLYCGIINKRGADADNRSGGICLGGGWRGAYSRRDCSEYDVVG